MKPLDNPVLECGCRVPDENMPTHGGDRSYTCTHERKWVIRSNTVTTVHYTIEEKAY